MNMIKLIEQFRLKHKGAIDTNTHLLRAMGCLEDALRTSERELKDNDELSKLVNG